MIDDTLNDGHTLVTGDLDGDGVDEVVAGYRGGGGGVNIYRLGANDQWSKFTVALRIRRAWRQPVARSRT